MTIQEELDQAKAENERLTNELAEERVKREDAEKESQQQAKEAEPAEELKEEPKPKAQESDRIIEMATEIADLRIGNRELKAENEKLKAEAEAAKNQAKDFDKKVNTAASSKALEITQSQGIEATDTEPSENSASDDHKPESAYEAFANSHKKLNKR